MRKLLIIASAGLLTAACALAGARAYSWDVTANGYDVTTSTTAGVSGYIDEIQVSTSYATSVVKIAVIPLDGVNDAIEIATNEVTAKAVWRPRIDGTTIGGTANASDAPERYMLTGETLRMLITPGTPSGQVWRATIKVSQ